MSFRYIITFSFMFLSLGTNAKEPTSQEMMAQMMVSMVQEGKTIKGILDLLKNNIPTSEYKNTLKLLKSLKEIDINKNYPKLTVRKNKIFSGNKFWIYVKSQNHIVIGPKKLNVKIKGSFALDKKLSVLLRKNQEAFYPGSLFFPEAEAAFVLAAPLVPYIITLGASALRVISLAGRSVGRHSPTALKFAMANVGLGAGPIKALASTVVGVKVVRMFLTKHELDNSFTCSENGEWIFRTLPDAQGPVDYTTQLWNPHDSATRKVFTPEEFYKEIREQDKKVAERLGDQKKIKCSAETLKKLTDISEEPSPKEQEDFEDVMA